MNRIIEAEINLGFWDMSQVSKRKIEGKIEQRIFEIFVESFAKLKNKDDVEGFLSELLTPTEKVMLAKRLSVAVLLEKGYDYRQIAEILKISSSTIGRVAFYLKSKGEGLKKIVSLILSDEKRTDFWKDIDLFVAKALTYHKGLYGIGERERLEASMAREENIPF